MVLVLQEHLPKVHQLSLKQLQMVWQ